MQHQCEADEKCKKKAEWRPLLGRRLCADHEAEALARLRASRYVRIPHYLRAR